MKKTALLLTCFLALLNTIASAQTSGKTGSLMWKFSNGTGTLTISGNGDMPNYAQASSPWYLRNGSIKTVVLTDGVKSIGSYAFSRCQNLLYVTIPNSVTGIGYRAFFVCSRLSSITVSWNVPITINDNVFNSIGKSLSNITLYVPSGTKSAYQANSVWGQLNIVEAPPTSHTITASADPNGSISPAGTTSVTHNGNQTFSFTASPGYEISQILVDNQSVAISNPYTFSNVTGNHSIYVSFKQNVQFPNISDALIITPPEFSWEYEGYLPIEPKPVTLENTSNRSLVIDKIEIGDEGKWFKIETQGLDTIKPADKSEDWTIVPVQGLKKGNYNTTIALYYHVANTSVPLYTTKPLSLNVYEAEYTISASAGANGNISPAGTISVTHNGSQTFNFSPYSGYEINQVLVDGVNNTSAVSNGYYTFSNITADHTLSVSFKQKAVPQYTISATAGTGGTISPSGTRTLNYGSSQTFYFYPNSGYEINDLNLVV
jgi:hypothetical protein